MDARATAQTIGFNNEGGRIAIQAAEYHVYGNNIVNQAQEGGLKNLLYAAEAPFNAYTRQHDPECLPSTRTALLEDIYAWTDGHDERCVYWLNGLAGTGKSTIARTVARRHYEQRSLGASFFFTRGGGDVSHARKFVTSIAVQLAYNVPVSRQHIYDAIAERPDIPNSALRDQWQQLVLRPLSALNTLGNITALVLVIDALNECDDDNDIRVIIGLLAEAQLLSGPKMRVFLTSRPEVAIRHGFYDVPNTLHQCFVLHHIASSVVDADIELFLKHNLAITGREQRLPADWPGSEIIAKMVQRASGLFIWAATAHNFIRLGGKRFAARRLNSIIKDDSDPQVEPEKHLDTIYTTILRNSICPEYTTAEKEEHCEMLRHILGSLVVIRSPLTVRSLGGLLDMTEEDIRSILEDLHAILDVPTDEMRPLRIHHPSLRDFLLDKSRCTDADFWVDKVQIHTALTSRCFTFIESFFEQNEGSNRKLVLKRHEDLSSERTRDTLEIPVEFGMRVKYMEKLANIYEQHEEDVEDLRREVENSLRKTQESIREAEESIKWLEESIREGEESNRKAEEINRVAEESIRWVEESIRGVENVGKEVENLCRGTENCSEEVENSLGEAENCLSDDEAIPMRETGHSGVRLDIYKGPDEYGEALRFTDLHYACCNWAYHLEQSGLKVVDGGQAHTFFKEYAEDWAMMLVTWSEHASLMDNITRLDKCTSKAATPQFYALLCETLSGYWHAMTSVIDLIEHLSLATEQEERVD
ncbi:putative WD-repeat protein [Alternaria alternata]|nr:putative WD-repeat protein [Alternaria alternata]